MVLSPIHIFFSTFILFDSHLQFIYLNLMYIRIIPPWCMYYLMNMFSVPFYPTHSVALVYEMMWPCVKYQ